MLQEAAVDALAEYLYSCGLEKCAIAVKRAVADTTRRMNGERNGVPFSSRVNTLLCTALFAMNCDTSTTPEGKGFLRTVIKEYRAAFMMPSDDFDSPLEDENWPDDIAPFDGYIIQNTEPGGFYAMDDIRQDIMARFTPIDAEETDSQVRDSVESLLRTGVFRRTSERDVFKRV